VKSRKKIGVSKPLIVTDEGVIKAGLLTPIIASLKEAGLPYAIYDRVVANPPLNCVAGATEMYRKEHCDGLIAVGGGSSMDTAKAAGVEISHGEPVINYECAEGKKRTDKTYSKTDYHTHYRRYRQ